VTTDARLDELFQQADVPACPEGWSVGPPGFVGIGAPRCGTSWWFRAVTTHPDVSHVRGVQPKEVHYFSGRSGRPLTEDEVVAYHRYFPRAPEAPVVGEWTPDYMYSPSLPGQLEQAAPGARLLVLLRDPVDRFVSGNMRGRRLAARNGIAGAEAEIAARNTERGMYWAPAARVLDAFGRDRVLVLQYERCRAEYATELRRTHEFLGLDPDRGFAPPMREPRERPVPEEERHRLGELYAPDVRKLMGMLPDLDASYWPNVARWL
jgi:sulfotransferase family protein